MKHKLPEDLEKSCSLCENAKKIETTGDFLCLRSGAPKKTSPDSKCRKFIFDILSYKPNPAKLSKYSPLSDDIEKL